MRPDFRIGKFTVRAVLIEPVRRRMGQAVRACDDEDANAFGVYRDDEGGFPHWVCDETTREKAEAKARRLHAAGA